MKPTNKGYILMGLQGTKGSACTTPDLAIPYLDESFNTGQQINALKDSGDNEYLLDNMKMEHRENFGFTVNARPELSTYLCAYMLGKDVLSATADPYTHTITRGDERYWLTLDRQLTTTVYQRLVDTKFENVIISGEAGKPVKISVDGSALTATMRTTGYTDTYDTERPYMFYDGSSRFKIDTTTSALIKGFQIKVNINSGGGLRDDQFEFIDLPDFNYSVDCMLDLYTTTITRFKKINYNSSTIPQEDLATGAFEIDCQYASTTTRQLKITIPKINWQSISGVNLNPEGVTMIESIAGVAVKQSTTELMTIVCQNGLNKTTIDDNDDLFILDNNNQVLIGVF
jgi:hypothetical protein